MSRDLLTSIIAIAIVGRAAGVGTPQQAPANNTSANATASGADPAAVLFTTEFGLVLRESPLRGDSSFESAKARAKKFLGEDEEGYRAQFVQLVDRAAMLRERTAAKVSRR